MAEELDFSGIEKKWTAEWEKEKLFESKPSNRKKFYITVAYPYPSGSMHVGHGRTYTVPDIVARFKRMQGCNVLFPMAWHVTGSPVLGIAERIKRKDPKTLRIYGELYGVSPEELEAFKEPKNIVKHFADEYRRDMTNLGFSIDWSRQFLTITPQYSKFIEWQYKNLHRQGLVKKGEHPVRYCPGCDNPVGDHDLLEGESATINEFTVIKFTLDDLVLPAATLRPETLFGVTNMWLNPDLEYVKTKVGDETWLLSAEAAEKMKYFSADVGPKETVKGSEFVGKDCVNPLDGRAIPILPATFVDADYATGVVMSVPAHAPYDYIALVDLKSDLPIISVIDAGEGDAIPAKKIVEEMGIKDQGDSKLEEATEILYRQEHAKGAMKDSIPKYGGMPVRQARERIAEDLIAEGKGVIFYEFSQNPVVCRCGTRCYVKLLRDQWFLEYSNPDWKKKAHECFDDMEIVPAETKQNFDYFVDWLKDWACTRRVGLGTRLPWDTNWLIEPLSDSTIYMAYYTISRHLKDIEPQGLGEEFFDYVFLGKGSAAEVSKKAGISQEKLNDTRKEFMYWYPPEWRFSAKDLVGNHLTFHVFHHTALFPKKCWPKGIVVFGMGLLEGNKMSSSKGNIILLSKAIESYGSDTVRLFLMSNAEPWQDFDWREALVKTTSRKIRQFYDQVSSSIELEGDMPERDIDRWLISKFEEAVDETTKALEGFQTRKALQNGFFNMLNDLAWYARRCDPNPGTLKYIADRWVRLMAPFTPFVCEELWSKIHPGEGYVSNAKYPVSDARKIDKEVVYGEEVLRNLMQDVQNILDVAKVTPKKIHVYLAPAWKRKLYSLIGGGASIAEAMKDADLRANGKAVASIIQKTRREEVPSKILSLDEEYTLISEAGPFLGREFRSEIMVHREADEGPENKAKNALPMKPGIYIEG